MQANLARLDGELKSPIGDGTTSGDGEVAKTASPVPVESLRHYRKSDKMPTARTPKPLPRAGDIEARLQILQQAIKDFAAVAEHSSVQIAVLPQKQSTAVVLIGVGYCRDCGTLYNGFSEGCPDCGTTAGATE